MKDSKIVSHFKEPITRWISPVVYFDETEPHMLKQELHDYQMSKGENSVENALATLFTNMLHNLDSERQPASWISGYFGAGKSMLTKYLGMSFDDAYRISKGKSIADIFMKKTSNEDGTSHLLKSWKKLKKKLGPSKTVLFDIGAKSGGTKYNHENSSNLRFDHIVLLEVQQSFGFGRNINIARKLFAKKNPLISEFLEYLQAIEQKNNFASLPIYRQNLIFSRFMRKQKPKTYTSDTDCFFTEYQIQDLPTVGESVRLINAMRTTYQQENDYPSLRLMIVIDEIFQHIYKNVDETDALEVFVEQIGVESPGNIWLFVTAQKSLNEFTRSGSESNIENNIGKMQDRFPKKYRLIIHPSNITKVIEKRMLQKTPECEDYLRELYAQEYNLQLVTQNKWTPTEVNIDILLTNHPLPIGAIDLLFRLLNQIKLVSERSASDSTNIRGIMQLLNSIFQKTNTLQKRASSLNVNDFLTLDYIYDHQKMSLPASIVKTTEKRLKELPSHTPLLSYKILKTISLLNLIEYYDCTVEQIAHCLYPSIGHLSIVDDVRSLLKTDLLNVIQRSTKNGKDIYQLQSEVLDSIEKTRISLSEEIDIIPTTQKLITLIFSSSSWIQNFGELNNTNSTISYGKTHEIEHLNYQIRLMSGYCAPYTKISIPTSLTVHSNRNQDTASLRGINIFLSITSSEPNISNMKALSKGDVVIWNINDSKNIIRDAVTRYCEIEARINKANSLISPNESSNSIYKSYIRTLQDDLVTLVTELQHDFCTLLERSLLVIDGEDHQNTIFVVKGQTPNQIFFDNLNNKIKPKCYPNNFATSLHTFKSIESLFQRVSDLSEVFKTQGLGLQQVEPFDCKGYRAVQFYDYLKTQAGIQPLSKTQIKQMKDEMGITLDENSIVQMLPFELVIKHFLRKPFGYSIYTIIAYITGFLRANKITVYHLDKNSVELLPPCGFPHHSSDLKALNRHKVFFQSQITGNHEIQWSNIKQYFISPTQIEDTIPASIRKDIFNFVKEQNTQRFLRTKSTDTRFNLKDSINIANMLNWILKTIGQIEKRLQSIEQQHNKLSKRFPISAPLPTSLITSFSTLEPIIRSTQSTRVHETLKLFSTQIPALKTGISEYLSLRSILKELQRNEKNFNESPKKEEIQSKQTEAITSIQRLKELQMVLDASPILTKEESDDLEAWINRNKIAPWENLILPIPQKQITVIKTSYHKTFLTLNNDLQKIKTKIKKRISNLSSYEKIYFKDKLSSKESIELKVQSLFNIETPSLIDILGQTIRLNELFNEIRIQKDIVEEKSLEFKTVSLLDGQPLLISKTIIKSHLNRKENELSQMIAQNPIRLEK